jgi:UDP-glucuronate decarboxylase
MFDQGKYRWAFLFFVINVVSIAPVFCKNPDRFDGKEKINSDDFKTKDFLCDVTNQSVEYLNNIGKKAFKKLYARSKLGEINCLVSPVKGHVLKVGHHVICLDSFLTGGRDNLLHLRGERNFSLIEQDVIHPLNLEHVDEIYNLACPASPVHYQYDPVHTMKTSVLGALNVLELAKKTGAKVFQASTSEVYGDPAVHPQTEEYWGNVNPIGPRSCYDEGKRAAETLFFDYHRTLNIPIKVVRIFNTYGPRMAANDGRVVSNFIVQALQGQDLTIYGDGSQTRSFCYADDLVEGFIRLMNADQQIIGPINMGNPGEFTMLELAEKVLRLTGSSSKLIHLPLPQDDPQQRQPDISKAKTLLGWSLTVPLEQGLERTIAYFKQALK